MVNKKKINIAKAILVLFALLAMTMIFHYEKHFTEISDNIMDINDTSNEEEYHDAIKICKQSYNRTVFSQPKSKVLFIITPTYPRPEQEAELTRLLNTISHLTDVVWIIAEDSIECKEMLQKFTISLEKLSIPFLHLSAPMPNFFREAIGAKEMGLPRGVAGRQMSLAWLLNNTIPSDEAVIYFADDDNAYSLDLFEELRKLKTIAMFPVGLISPFGISSPILDPDTNKISGFVGGNGGRKFPIDMAGFATSLRLIHQKRPVMPYKSTFEEEGYISSLKINIEDIETHLAGNCTKILVWHTMTMTPKFAKATSLVSSLKQRSSTLLCGMALMGFNFVT